MSNTKTLKGRVINKHKTAAEWYLDVYVSADSTTLREDPFIPYNGELIVYDPDSVYTERRTKIGDGVTNVHDLPFSTKQADWSQNDENAADYVKNRTHYPEVAIRAETTVSQEEQSTFYGMFTSRLDVESLVGKIITLDINGNVYQYELKRELYEDEHVLYYVGDWLEYSEGGTSGFSAELSDTDINLLLPEFYGKTAPSTIPVSISYIESPLKQLDEKYIPAGISRTTEVNTIKNTLSSEINRIKDKDWEQTDESAGDFIKNRTHGKQAEIFTGDIYVGEDYSKDHIWVDTNFGYRDYDFSFDLVRVFDEDYDIDKFTCSGIEYDGSEDYTSSECTKNYKVFYNLKSVYAYAGDALCNGIAILANEPVSINLYSFASNPASVIDLQLNIKIPSKGLWITRYATVKDATLVKYNYKQLDEKYIPDTIARVDNYNKYHKDAFSENDTAKAISAKSAAFGFNTQAGSFAYTVTALDPVAKTFTLDSVEGLEVDDIYTVDLSFYKADGTATEELYTNYGKITAISADNVVTVDTFPSDVARYRVPDEPYIDENGLDGEENVFRVIAKPNVGNRAIGTKTFAIGNSSQALSKNSVAMGKACIAYGAHSVAIGYDNKTAYAATSFGRSNTASGVKSVAIGYNNTSSGEGSIAFGNSNTSSNKGSFASGTSNKATGTNSFAAGHSNKVQGKYSIALGYNNTSSGEGSIAFGNSNTSSNKGSFASGTSNNATGTNSFALGSTNRATGTSSFAHGYNNDATKTGSAVFGTNSKSQGEASFAAGASVEALGHYSQAFGYKTKATGRASFAEGEGTIASSKNQHVQGRYNIEDAAIKYAHIIGNGKDDQNRKNIYTVDWNGNAWFAGEVRVGEGNEKLVTETELNEKITIAIGNAIGGAY